mmetsp:Transcript_26308/g.84150  ORF Transcript_26308/g.84150 Transcript_26308/m.84150 type:complete len:240 (-) Transcript_26308:1464-2183(-)
MPPASPAARKGPRTSRTRSTRTISPGSCMLCGARPTLRSAPSCALRHTARTAPAGRNVAGRSRAGHDQATLHLPRTVRSSCKGVCVCGGCSPACTACTSTTPTRPRTTRTRRPGAGYPRQACTTWGGLGPRGSPGDVGRGGGGVRADSGGGQAQSPRRHTILVTSPTHRILAVCGQSDFGSTHAASAPAISAWISLASSSSLSGAPWSPIGALPLPLSMDGKVSAAPARFAFLLASWFR